MADGPKPFSTEWTKEQLRKDVLAGSITINEYLAETGRPLLPPSTGDVCIVPEGHTVIHSDDLVKLLRRYGIVDHNEIEQLLTLAAEIAD